LNALTNLAFLLAGLVMWHRARGLPMPRILAAGLMLIGVGSGLFHTLATRWAALADVLPIMAFILTYVLAANRLVLGWRWRWAALGALAVLPFAAVAGAGFAALPGFRLSAAYWPVALLIAAYAVALRRRAAGVARGFGLGAALLALSLTLRSLDGPLCALIPVGTHFLWHLLNAILLAWMIEVLIRHCLAARGAGR
jgi:hypothetical protein